MNKIYAKKRSTFLWPCGEPAGDNYVSSRCKARRSMDHEKHLQDTGTWRAKQLSPAPPPPSPPLRRAEPPTPAASLSLSRAVCLPALSSLLPSSHRTYRPPCVCQRVLYKQTAVETAGNAKRWVWNNEKHDYCCRLDLKTTKNTFHHDAHRGILPVPHGTSRDRTAAVAVKILVEHVSGLVMECALPCSLAVLVHHAAWRSSSVCTHMNHVDHRAD